MGYKVGQASTCSVHLHLRCSGFCFTDFCHTGSLRRMDYIHKAKDGCIRFEEVGITTQTVNFKLITTSHLHPGGVSWVKAPIKGDCVIHMRTEGPCNVHYRHSERLRILAFWRLQFTNNVEICSSDVAVNEESQVGGVHMVFEVCLVHLNQIVVPFFCALYNT